MTTKAPETETETQANAVPPAASVPQRVLTPEAERALAEAAERRQRAADQAAAAKEIGGREGPDPVRFGDWEKGGIASDF